MVSPRADGLSVSRAKGSPADRAAAAASRENRRVDSAARIDKWREENPNALRTWTTKYGCVVQFWGVRIYYGECADCKALVHTRRDVSGYREGQTHVGRWPKQCDQCRQRRSAEHNDRARGRMRRHRARDRYPFEDETRYAKSGRAPTPEEKAKAVSDARECEWCCRVISKARFDQHECHPV
jgi:hypothetical protein